MMTNLLGLGLSNGSSCSNSFNGETFSSSVFNDDDLIWIVEFSLLSSDRFRLAISFRGIFGSEGWKKDWKRSTSARKD